MAKTRSRLPATFHRRSSGLLLHITSLPGPHGSGDLGAEAHRFVDFCGDAGQSWWQMLPVGPPGPAPGFSPYSSTSSLAGNPYLIGLEPLVEDGMLTRRDMKPLRLFSSGRAEYERGHRLRDGLLRRAFESFRTVNGRAMSSFRRFGEREAEWLEDEALFAAVRSATDRPW